MVGVIIHDEAALPVTPEVETAAWCLERIQMVDQSIEADPLNPTRSQGSDSIAQVVQTRQWERDTRHMQSLFVEIRNGSITFKGDGQGCEIDVVAALN